MEGRPDRLVDYFVVVGLGEKNVSPFKVVPLGDAEETLHLTLETAAEPVTDIVLVASKHEACPKGYK